MPHTSPVCGSRVTVDLALDAAGHVGWDTMHALIAEFNRCTIEIVRGQVHGGVAQGVGQALHEHTVYDPESGQLLSASFMDYALPRAEEDEGGKARLQQHRADHDVAVDRHHPPQHVPGPQAAVGQPRPDRVARGRAQLAGVGEDRAVDIQGDEVRLHGRHAIRRAPSGP